jgi:hypothetical protein
MARGRALSSILPLSLFLTLPGCNDEKTAATRVAAEMNPIFAELRPSVKKIRDAKKEEPLAMAKLMAEPCVAMRPGLVKLGRLEFPKKASVDNQATTVKNAANALATNLDAACGKGNVFELGTGVIDCSTKCQEGLTELEKRIAGLRKLTDPTGVALDEL